MASKVKKWLFSTELLVFSVLICIYAVPANILGKDLPFQKLIFLAIFGFVYFFNFILNNKCKRWHFIFFITLAFLILLSRNINFITFFPLVMIDDFIENKEKIYNYINKSSILYVCLAFTIFYSILYFGIDGRYAHSAIKEINQSGLAIFCLALLLLKKNKPIGIATILFGLLTLSRSYYLSVIIFLISITKVYKKITYKFKKFIDFFSYGRIVLLSTVLLFALGGYYIIQYYSGNILEDNQISNRLLCLLDYSNFFRFSVIYLLFMIFIKHPDKLLFGMSDDYYISRGGAIADELSIPHREIVPHNLFLSHLKIYGLFSIFETIFISKKLSNVINYNNFAIYFIIVLYSLILGAGLYSFWLFLSITVLILYNISEVNYEK